MDARDVALVAVGSLLSVLLLWKVARQFLITGLFVVTWLVFYEECKDTYAAKLAMIGARKGVGLMTAKISEWAGIY